MQVTPCLRQKLLWDKRDHGLQGSGVTPCREVITAGSFVQGRFGLVNPAGR